MDMMPLSQHLCLDIDLGINKMRYKKLNNTMIEIAAVGQGCMGIGGYLFRDSLQDENNVKALRLGIQSGMTFLDTAEAYGSGHSEEVVSEAISGIRKKVFIASKVSPEHLSYRDVLKSAEGSLSRLKTDYIDLYQIHWPNPQIPLEESMKAMTQLVKEGKVRYVGVSNFSLREIKDALKMLPEGQFVSVQAEYNLFDRTIEEDILPYCEKEGISVIAYSPLMQGKLIGDEEKSQVLQKISRKYNKTVAQVSLNWLIHHAPVIVIPKAISDAHIKENAQAADFSLSEEDVREIDNIFTNKPITICVEEIRVSSEYNRVTYQTLEDALENKLGFVPSPADLAKNIHSGEILKPVRLVTTKDTTGKYRYDLVEGRIRYWAWVIAYNGQMPIPAFIWDNSMKKENA